MRNFKSSDPKIENKKSGLPFFNDTFWQKIPVYEGSLWDNFDSKPKK